MAKGRGLDEAYKAFIMVTCAVVYSVVMLGPWGWIKNWANIASVPGFVAYAAMFLGANLLLVPGLYYLTAWVARVLARDRQLPLEDIQAIGKRFFAPLRLRADNPQDASGHSSGGRSLVGQGTLPPVRKLFVDYAYALVPMGLAGRIAFSLSFVFVNVSYAIPLLSDPFGWGWNLLGTAAYPWTPYVPEFLPFLQVPVLLVGLAFSINTAHRISRRAIPGDGPAFRATVPVAAFLTGAFDFVCNIRCSPRHTEVGGQLIVEE